MMDGEPRMPFVPPQVLELWPRSPAARRELHRIHISGAMSSLLGTGMKREIQRAHPDWSARKVSLKVGSLNWGWEIAPPLYGPLEDEARARGGPPTRRAEFLASWRLEPADEPIVRNGGRKRSIEEIQAALDRLFSAGPCG